MGPDVCEPLAPARVELSWIPLGAGGHVVRRSGRLFEWFAAARQHRPPCALYHCALVVKGDAGMRAIELAPAGRSPGWGRGVQVTGPVGLRWAGRLRLFRYEVRCRSDGVIPDLAEAMQSPVIVSTDRQTANLVVRMVGRVPALTWGRDESGAGEMWNSNSVISWLLQRSGVDAAALTPPAGGRAPGWTAGIVVATAPGSVSGPRSLPGA